MSEVVVITGASSGIGRSAAISFAEEGSGLFLVARREERLRDVAEQCLAIGAPRTEISAHDLSKPGEGARLVSFALERMSKIDVLVCNAGYGCFTPVADYSAEKMARMWQVNFQSAYESIQAALPHFLQRGSGHIVLVSSIIGKKGMPFSAPYCATKFAQVGLGEALWGELREKGIGVSVICPGYTETEFHEVAAVESNKAQTSRPLKGQSSRVVGQAIVRAVRKKKRQIHLTWPAKLLLLINRISTRLADYIMLKVSSVNR